MAENSQDVWQEITRWEQETGHSLEAVYNTPAGEAIEGVTEDQRREAVRLWERYQAAGGGFGSDVD